MDKAPKLFAQYKPMLDYLEKKTGYKFEFVFSSTYEDLIDNFKNGKVDIVELGPLPFVKLHSSYKDAEAFLTFKSKNQKPFYTCNLVTTDEDINSLDDINTKGTKIILTRRLSTCGYLMSEFIFNKNSKSLKSFDYKYVGAHSKVLLELLLEDNSIGTAKSTIVNKYNNFKFKLLAKSPPIPGFAFVANKKTISQEQIHKIQKAILALQPATEKKDAEFISKWGSNIKYGAIKTKLDAYDVIKKSIKNIQIPEEKR
jgi:phosphonate transport system substrate-binding protein